MELLLIHFLSHYTFENETFSTLLFVCEVAVSLRNRACLVLLVVCVGLRDIMSLCALWLGTSS